MLGGGGVDKGKIPSTMFFVMTRVADLIEQLLSKQTRQRLVLNTSLHSLLQNGLQAAMTKNLIFRHAKERVRHQTFVDSCVSSSKIGTMGSLT